MRRFLALPVVAVLAVVLSACNSSEKQNNLKNTGTRSASTPTPSSPSDGVRRITTVELRDAVDNGTAVVIDVRGAADFERNHIKGSIHIPVDDFPRRIAELPPDKMIVTYCS